MAIISTIVVNGVLEYWPKYFGGLTGVWDPKIKYFKIGEGGWEDPGTGVAQRRTPDAAQTDLDCIANPGRYPATSLYSFEKTLLASDLTYETNVLKATCSLTNAQGNDTGSADFWEIGLYSDHPSGAGKLLVAYGTFPRIIKTAAAPLTLIVRVSFAR